MFPSSHSSPFVRFPSPQPPTHLHRCEPPAGGVAHLKPSSTAQLSEHPSPAAALPSSHPSPRANRPSPHTAAISPVHTRQRRPRANLQGGGNYCDFEPDAELQRGLWNQGLNRCTENDGRRQGRAYYCLVRTAGSLLLRDAPGMNPQRRARTALPPRVQKNPARRVAHIALR